MNSRIDEMRDDIDRCCRKVDGTMCMESLHAYIEFYAKDLGFEDRIAISYGHLVYDPKYDLREYVLPLRIFE